ncbi:MAG: glycoside hydrolase family 3 C-terminal domain-containing protein [Bacilli bacterium]|nr:glycoside hydrolase family 3 C-terminal domain-containing protein [Bacilli bacterium]
MKAKNRRITYLAIIGGAVLALLGGVTIAANVQENNLDLLLGRGKQHTKDNSSLDGNYIDFEFDNQDDALKNAQRMTQLTAEEGMTLLKNKNNALPLAANEGVTVLGYYSWHNNMSGGEDPASTSGAVSLANGIEQDTDIPFNQATKQVYATANGDFVDPATALASAESTFASYPTAVITLKRNSGEGNDQSLNQGMSEQNRSGLVINNAELKLIDYACKHFNKVIIVVNSANAMELGWLQENDPNMDSDGNYTDPYTGNKYDFSKVNGAIWAGCCGSQGGIALANILKGAVNPSGHLVDTYVRDLRKDPTYKNFGSYVYSNSDELNSYQDETFFVDYEEGIYVGYRYYETAYKEAKEGNYNGFDYAREVVFPFGYGLSYTTFAQEFAETPSFDAASNEYTFKVKVTNTGPVAGKGVAQIYVNVPYTAENKANHVEKSHVVLGGFGKTEILAAGASETLEIKVNRDYFTSYDYQVEKAYVLDAGNYNFYLSDNAHSWADIDEMTSGKEKVLWTDNLSKKVVYKDGVDGKRSTDKSVAINKEDDELNYHFKNFGEADHGEGYAINFTRTNFKDSFPQSPVEDDFELTDARALKQVARYDVWAEENNPIKEMPSVNTDGTSYTLASMRGVDFNDPKWDDYMNQFTLSKMVEMVTNGGWNEKADVENGVPESYDADSPYGYYAHALTIKNINKWYCGDPMVAATFNEKLARELGEAFGEEAHANYLAGGTLITGIYGYGLNMHRSAFGGRNYEYYSEDGILAGKMAAAEAGGASEKGLITFMKHYALNDQETNRQKNGYCSWVNEQAFREVYLKGWELYMKEAKMEVKYYAQVGEELDTNLSKKTMSAATGIMTCYNRIGATWGGASVSIHDILEDEFGFTGTAITDAGGQKNTYMTSDFMLRRGGHLTLTNNGTDGLYDTSSPTAVYHLKDATKHILFNKANSNCVQGISPSASIWYEMSPWKSGLIAGWIVAGVLALVDAAFIALIALGKINVKERKEPEEEY